MIKICSESLTVPLRIISEQSLKEGKFPKTWKKANIVAVRKIDDKNLLKNYRPVSLLLIFRKLFERVKYNSLSNRFQISNILLLHNQVFYLLIHVLPNYSLLYIKYKQYLITIQLLMWEVWSKTLTLIRLGFLKLVFPGGVNLMSLFIFQEELIWFRYNYIQLLNNLFKVCWRWKNADIIFYKVTSLVYL